MKKNFIAPAAPRPRSIYKIRMPFVTGVAREVMTTPPGRTVDNMLVLLAAALVAGAAFPWAYRLPCGIGAVVIFFLMAYTRLRGMSAKTQKRRTGDTYAAVERLRAERKERFERGRPKRRV